MLDVKPSKESRFFDANYIMSYRQLNLFTVDLVMQAIRPLKKVCWHQDKTVGEFKLLLCEHFPALIGSDGDSIRCRIVVDDDKDDNFALTFLDAPEITMEKCTRSYSANLLYVDCGTTEVLDEDRNSEIKESKFMKVLMFVGYSYNKYFNLDYGTEEI
jgi:hypothetical protein